MNAISEGKPLNFSPEEMKEINYMKDNPMEILPDMIDPNYVDEFPPPITRYDILAEDVEKLCLDLKKQEKADGDDGRDHLSNWVFLISGYWHEVIDLDDYIIFTENPKEDVSFKRLLQKAKHEDKIDYIDFIRFFLDVYEGD